MRPDSCECDGDKSCNMGQIAVSSTVRRAGPISLRRLTRAVVGVGTVPDCMMWERSVLFSYDVKEGDGESEGEQDVLTQTTARMLMARYEPHKPYATRAIMGKPTYGNRGVR